MTKYNLDFKMKVLHRYFEGASMRSVARQFKIAQISTVSLWLSRFQKYGLAGLESRAIHAKYTSEFKLSVINWMKQHSATMTKTALHFDIPAPSTVWQWAKAFECDGLNGLVTRQERRHPMAKKKSSKPSSKPSDKAADMEIHRLKQELELLRVENAFLKKSMP